MSMQSGLGRGSYRYSSTGDMTPSPIFVANGMILSKTPNGRAAYREAFFRLTEQVAKYGLG